MCSSDLHSPMFYVHWKLEASARAQLPAEYSERAAYVAAGSVEVEGNSYEPGHMLVFAKGEPVLFRAVAPSIVMLLGGEPVGERFIEWNFVSSERAKIEAARNAWAEQTFGKVPGEENEWTRQPARKAQ